MFLVGVSTLPPQYKFEVYPHAAGPNLEHGTQPRSPSHLQVGDLYRRGQRPRERRRGGETRRIAVDAVDVYVDVSFVLRVVDAKYVPLSPAEA